MKKLVLFFLTIISLSASNLNAQYYNAGVGLRGGTNSGLSLIGMLGDGHAAHAIVHIKWQGIGVTGLYQYYSPASISDLYWFFGFGAHVGFYDGSNVEYLESRENGTYFGIDGIIGAEYDFSEFMPITAGVDFKPQIDFFDKTEILPAIALTIRYIF